MTRARFHSGRFAPRRGRSPRIIALTVGALLLLQPGIVLAAPNTTFGDASTQAVFCGATPVTVKVSANTVGSSGFQTCTGTVLVQRITVFLEKCDADFVICFHWATIRTYASCSRFGAGGLSCPAAGTYNARPGAGKYRTRTEGQVTDSSGGATYSGVGWGAEVRLTS